MELLLVVIILILLFGGGFSLYRRSGSGHLMRPIPSELNEIASRVRERVFVAPATSAVNPA